jgi:UDPglucose 6-dehydrogenase
LEQPYNHSDCKEQLQTCDVVFVAVPTPSTPKGYDASIIRAVIPCTAPGTIVVLKSTILPGLTKVFQKEFPDRIIIHSPEFLSEATAKEDAERPFMNIVGITENNDAHRKAAEIVLSVLPVAPYLAIVTSEEAELIKYSHNCAGYMQVVFFNMMYDLSESLGAEWSKVQEALEADPFVAHRYISPLHKTGRGAGGHCFIKDFAALRSVYEKTVDDAHGVALLRSAEEKNNELLQTSGKDLDLLEGVYGLAYGGEVNEVAKSRKKRVARISRAQVA